MRTARYFLIGLAALAGLVLAGPGLEGAEAGQRWAVLVGVNEYTEFGNLRYCVADVRALRDRLLEAGFPKQNVFLLADGAADPGELPFRRNVQREISAVLKVAVKEDLVVIAFSGHGVHLDGKSYFCPTDASLDSPDTTMVPLDLIYRQLETSAANQKLLLVDACRNDPRPASSRDAAAHTKSLEGLGEQLRHPPEGTVVLSSSAPGQISWEDEQLGHGVFLYYLLEGLAGKAADADGQVSLLALYRYANLETRRFVLRHRRGYVQTPELRGTITGDIVLASRGVFVESPSVMPPAETAPLVAVFTVREENANGPLIEGATVELSHREPDGTRPSLLAAGRTDSSGRAQLTVKLSLSQQAQGTFGASVRRGDLSRNYTLDKFPQSRSYALYLPRVTPPPSPSVPPSTPAQAGRTIENSIGIKLAFIPAGEFLMGSSERDSSALDWEKPQHTVRIAKPFYLGVTEVTQEQYERVMETNPSRFRYAQLPVENVSWEDAVEFCRKLSALPAEQAAGRVYRLPTEAEWEYACRAGSKTIWSFGDSELSLDDYAWYISNSGSKTHPVGQKKPNAWGLYDMHGNVREWCSDWSRREYTTAVASDPTGPGEGSFRVNRGAGWYGHAWECRSAVRDFSLPEYRIDELGFRLAFSPPRPASPPSPAVPSSSLPRSKPHDTFENSIGMKLVLIPAGEFMMGSPDTDWDAHDAERPQQLVRITKAFYLAVTEVTQEQYERVMESNPSKFKGAQLPVESVSWEDAMAFCRKLSQKEGRMYRLPTEAEWEYACRAGTKTKWSFGDDESALKEYAWYTVNANRTTYPGGTRNTTHPVGTRKPNAWGMYDMHGNVWEWCSDWYGGAYTTATVADPMGPAGGSFRVFRGGSWKDRARFCRSAVRNWYAPVDWLDCLGFRLASSLEDASGR